MVNSLVQLIGKYDNVLVFVLDIKMKFKIESIYFLLYSLETLIEQTLLEKVFRYFFSYYYHIDYNGV